VPETFLSLATGVALSSAVGFNAYLPLLVTGVLARTTDLITLGPPYDQLEEPAVLSVIAAIAVVDFIGDKVPAVDHAFHLVGAVVAPVVGAALAVAVTQDTGIFPAVSVILGVLAAGATHGARSSVRPFSTLTTGGIGNPILSLGEDGLSATLSFLAIVVPLIALASCIVILAFIAWVLTSRRRRRSRTDAPRRRETGG
jgi:hypothetical protein